MDTVYLYLTKDDLPKDEWLRTKELVHSKLRLLTELIDAQNLQPTFLMVKIK